MQISIIKPEGIDQAGAMPLPRHDPRSILLDGTPAAPLMLVLALLLLSLCTAPGQINPGIVDPTNSYASSTYNQLAAGWWQYFMSLPMTNNPLNYIPGNPPVPVSTGQSGPVWFIGGSYTSGGTLNFTNTIPSVGLFLIISGIERDNAGCPPTSFNEPYLRTSAGIAEFRATNMTCTIDNVPITQIDDVTTTPYRVQSPAFSYTCPAVENYLYTRNKTCYWNDSGIPYTIDGAIIDGVFLMISPLSLGSHVIHVTVEYPTFQPAYAADFTHYLTVQPAPLSIALSRNGQFVLSWPQAPDTYTLESSSNLQSPWEPVTNLSLSITDGIYQATGPIAATNKFFRLRPN